MIEERATEKFAKMKQDFLEEEQKKVPPTPTLIKGKSERVTQSESVKGRNPVRPPTAAKGKPPARSDSKESAKSKTDSSSTSTQGAEDKRKELME